MAQRLAAETETRPADHATPKCLIQWTVDPATGKLVARWSVERPQTVTIREWSRAA